MVSCSPGRAPDIESAAYFGTGNEAKMRKIVNWSEWGIATKILFMFLALLIVSMLVIGLVTNYNIRNLGSYAIDTSTTLGQRAINDSTSHLNQLGEDIIIQKSRDVAKQVEMYFATRPPMSIEEMRNDPELRDIVVQTVGTTGYTTLIDPVNEIIVIHKFLGQEKDLKPLKNLLPVFWTLLKVSAGGRTAGYYKWLEVDGSINQKFAGIEPVKTVDGKTLNLWATTYITEFSMPAEQTKEDILAGIRESSNHINQNMNDIQDLFFIIFTVLVIVVIGLALLLSRVITSPIKALKQGAEAVGKGNLGYKIAVKNKDELGDLANSFNNMAAALKTYTEQLKSTAAENIDNERKIQENLRIYMRKVGQAQEDERKRISRELHDDSIQALVVVSRELDDIATGDAKITPKDIRKEIRKIIEGLRRFSQELRPSILDDLGLIPAVKWLTSDLIKNYGIEVNTEITGPQRNLPQETELMLFRIIQEALTNIRRHSQATRATVRLEFSDRNITVIVQDNGKGFEKTHGVSDLARTGKLGLAGMRERAELLGGTIHVETKPGRGTTLTVDVPL